MVKFNTKNLKMILPNFISYLINIKQTATTSLQYQKKFFRDGNLVPDESLFFLIKFIPFAEIRGAANSFFED